MVSINEVKRTPGYGFRRKGALNLPDTWYFAQKHSPSGFPLTPAVFVTMAFEETACCNMVQYKCPAAIGPAQLQVSEIGKVHFFACQDPAKDNFLREKWDSSKTILAVDQKTVKVFTRPKRLHPELPELTKEKILGDNEFSIKMHIKYFQWHWMGYGDGQRKGLSGMLSAQTGGNSKANTAFEDGAKALMKVMRPDPSIRYDWPESEWQKFYKLKREEFRGALNVARKGIHNNPVGTGFEDFFQFLLPDAFLQNPLGYIRCGF